MSRNNNYSVKGFLNEVLQSRQVQGTQKTFTVQEFIVKTEEDYPQLIRFELFDDKSSQVASIPNGQCVEVSFSQRGREYQGKVYNSNRAWKVEVVAGGLAPNTTSKPSSKPAAAQTTQRRTAAPVAAPAAQEAEETPF